MLLMLLPCYHKEGCNPGNACRVCVTLLEVQCVIQELEVL
jgi:hypothetical protein